MKLGRLNHISVARPSIAVSMVHFTQTMGATRILTPFDLEEQGVKICFVDTATESGYNGTQIGLIEPLSDASPIAGFFANIPLGGQHHICFEVEDIEHAPSGSRSRVSASLAPRASARMAPRSSFTRKT